MSLSLNPVLPWPIVLLVAGALLWLVFGVYRRRVESQPTPVRLALMTLRATMAVVLSLAMLRPSLEWTEPDERPWQIAVLADASRSMTVEDGPNGEARREFLAGLLAEARAAVEDSGRVELQVFDFDETLRPVDELPPGAEGDWTDLAGAVGGLRDRLRGQRVLTTVLFSDGAVRTPRPTGDEVAAAARAFSDETGASISPVAFGSSDVATRGLDLAVEDLLVEPVAFAKKTVPVRTRVRLSGFADRPATVRVLLEDRDGRDVGESGTFTLPDAGRGTTPSATITAESGDVTLPVELTFVPERTGDLKLRVEVESQDGEVQTANNARETLITVRENGLRVAYFDSARWEQKFIRRVNRTAQIQIDYVFTPTPESLTAALADSRWFEEGGYDVYLIGDVPAAAFESGSDFGRSLAQAARRGAGIGIVAGSRLLARRPPDVLSAVLPVRWDSVDPRERDGGFPIVPTARGLAHYVLRIGTADVWETLPPLERVFPLEPRNESILVLAETPEGTPLIFAADTGLGRSAVLAAPDTWLWYTAGHADLHQRFWQQLLLWLGRKELDTERQTFLSADPRVVDSGRPVALTFGARDSEGLRRSDVSFQIEVRKPSGQTISVPTSGETAEFEDTSEDGDYWATLTAVTADGVTLPPATTRFLVNAADPELDNPAADTGLLDDIAAATGGVSMRPDAFAAWFDDLLAASEENEVVRTTAVALWDGWPLLVTFLLLLLSEWTVRRVRGLV